MEFRLSLSGFSGVGARRHAWSIFNELVSAGAALPERYQTPDQGHSRARRGIRYGTVIDFVAVAVFGPSTVGADTVATTV